MNEIEIIKLAMNAGYLALSFTIIFMIRDFARSFAKDYIAALKLDTAEKAKLAEKIDALSKGSRP